MKGIKIVANNRKGFVFVDGALRAVEVKSEYVYVDENNDMHNEVLVTDGEEYWRIDVEKYYLTREAYERDKPCMLTSTCYCSLIGEFNQPTQILVLQDDGEITQQTIHIKRVGIDYCSDFVWDCEWKSNNPYPEDKCFRLEDRAKAISWAEYNKIGADGSVEKIQGASVRMLLTDKQKALVDKLKNVLKELKDNDVFMASDGTDNLFALNVKDFNIEADIDDLSGQYEEIDWLNDKFKVADRRENLLIEYSVDWNFYLRNKK